MAEAKWYVAHTYSGYENKVKANIEKAIENRHLENEILEVRVPMEDVVEVKNGVRKQVQKKLFPGYVLLNMVMNDDTWYVVRNTRGVTGFVGPGSKPVPLSPGEIERLTTPASQQGRHEYRARRCCHRYCRRLGGDHGRGFSSKPAETDRNDPGRTFRAFNACRDQFLGS